ncbi:uncharacterized protein LOC135389740 [Ornithodoros turicata]|uniref:uncharacterized protein LOC135389740 n=1 Tax=Ornithodoros turicata TaxID=34597 RepID=UPI00313A2EAB
MEPSSEADAPVLPSRLGTVSFNLPPFRPADPTLWFVHLEFQFATRGIVNHLTKFHYMVAACSPVEAAEVRDIIMAPPATGAYDKIKEELVRRTSSEQRRLQQLITAEELVDRKPFQLLRRMQQLLDDRATSTNTSILRELFLQRLPSNVRIILISSEDIPIEGLAQLAGKIMDNMSPMPPSALSSVSTEQSKLARPRADLEKLTDLVTSSLRLPRSHSPSPLTSSQTALAIPSPPRLFKVVQPTHALLLSREIRRPRS